MGIPVTLTNVIIAYPHLAEAHLAPLATEPRYSVECIFDANRRDILQRLEETFAKVLTDAGKGDLVANMTRPWKDGTQENDRRAATGKKPREEIEGKYYIRANSKNPVDVVDRRREKFPNLETIRAEVFGGCICNVGIDMYWTLGGGVNPGVFCGLNGVQLVSNINVQRLGGGPPSIESMFDVIDDGPAPADPPWM